MQSSAKTVAAYLDGLPADRRGPISAVRDLVNRSLPRGFEETIQYGMISWVVPLSRYPTTYNGQALAVASLGSQKGHMALYMTCIYADEGARRRFEEQYAASGKKLDMGKSCLRFKRLDDLALDVVSAALSRASVEGFLAAYEAARAGVGKKAPAKKAAAKKAPAKKPARG